VNAFGFPNSKVRGHWIPGDTCRYFFQHLGWFTEVRTEVKLKIPPDSSCVFLLRTGEGRILNELPAGYSFEKVVFREGEAYLRIRRGG
jgi:hypothetical protein